MSDSPISTPSGGGAQSGLGEKFSPDLFTGTGNFSVPISVPSGRNGLQPELTLSYSTGNGPFGMGWGISVPGVTRKTSKGVPRYRSDQDVFILSGAEDLVPVSHSDAEMFPGSGSSSSSNVTQYRPRTEGLFARIYRYLDNDNDYWKVMNKDGRVSYYGTPGAKGDASLDEDPATVADQDNRWNIYSWHLTKTEDLFGNKILYDYERDQDEDNYHHWDQLYLSRIRYVDYEDNNGEEQFLVEVRFTYEERPDPFSQYSAGFDIRTRKRCKKIEIFTHPDDVETLTKTYHLQYLDERANPGKLPHNGVSLLARIDVEGHDGSASQFLPPLDFRYTDFQPQIQEFQAVEGDALPYDSLGDPNYQLVDLFGNGLPDIVEINDVIRYWRNKGGGRFAMPKTMAEAPVGLDLADQTTRIIDGNGDGRADVMVTAPDFAGYFSSRFGASWDRESFQRYRQAPTFNLFDPDVKLLDLNGDGVTDAIRSGESFECFFNDSKDGWHETRRVPRKNLDSFPNVDFSDPHIAWADMSGDGLMDIVYIRSGVISYWPSLGYGNFARKVQMKNCPRYPQNYDPARILLGDVDGDGQADLVYVGANKVTFWINHSGNGWTEPVEIGGIPTVQDPSNLQLIDLLGNGISGVLFSIDPLSSGRRNHMYFLDLTGGIKPYLLHEMDNNMGSLTRTDYKPSTHFYLADQYGFSPFADEIDDIPGGTRRGWKTTLPFPVQVVERVEVIDQLSRGKLTTEYSYHHGYWDGGEREFRGFGRVDQRDTETFQRYNHQGMHNARKVQDINTPVQNNNYAFLEKQQKYYSPPTETRHWFHLGPIGDAVGGWQEVDFEDEYWAEDPPTLARSQDTHDLLESVPGRAKRDALRALRGSKLRTELYALDRQQSGRYIPGADGRPYTVTENRFGLRQEFDPSTASFPGGTQGGTSLGGNTKGVGSGHIFFSHSEASRTTQWERGKDPMTQLTFTGDYDVYGQPRRKLNVAVPRGRDYRHPSGPDETNPDWLVQWTQGDPYLATCSQTTFAQKDEPGAYMVDRTCRSTGYEVVNDGKRSAFELRDQVMPARPSGGADTLPVQASTLSYKIISQSLTFYDGSAFTGRPFGEPGNYGAQVRSENLVITDSIITEAYDTKPQCFENIPDWSSYPSGFQNTMQDSNGRLGYTKHDHASEPEYTTGFYTVTDKTKYDFHDSPSTGKGLVVEKRDPFDNISKIEYDKYRLLPEKAHQVIDPGTNYKLTTVADYDYRVLKAQLITDPNDNQSAFRFTPLGLLEKTVVMGKQGENKGDTLTHPSVKMEYDFQAFKNHGQPIWVKTIQRVNHWQDQVNDEVIESVEFTDGFGRLLQTRSLAEDVIYGDPTTSIGQTFGDSGLPTDQTQNQPSVGVQKGANEADNVRVTGWKVHNNKGKVVEQYEPFFAKGFTYNPPNESQKGQRTRMYYDPRGQVVRTVNPDNSEQRVLFGIPDNVSSPTANPDPYSVKNMSPTPWETYTYDANDLAGITHPSESGPYSDHWWTPKSAKVDAKGRTIHTMEWLTGGDTVEMTYEYDIRGNVLKVTDALGRIVYRQTYDLADQAIYTQHIDSGEKWILFDCTGKPIELTDAKESVVLNAYDVLNRPVQVWARDNNSEPFTVRHYNIYGDDQANGPASPLADNYMGKLYKQYDESGLTTILGYDFKGNVLAKEKQVIKDSILLTEINNGSNNNWNIEPYRTNWTDTPWDEESTLLEGSYRTDMQYDALDRTTEIEYPEDVTANRKKLIPVYNRAGSLEKVTFDGVTHIERIAYNAKGQRLLLIYGGNNAKMTRYTYDDETFRLTRIRTEAYSKNSLEYKGNGGVLQDRVYTYDVTGNILSTNDSCTGCGLPSNPDVLLRQFKYDSLYRLKEATGRECNATKTNPWDHEPSSCTDPINSNSYTRKYSYDKMGNMLTMQQTGTNSFTRIFNPDGMGNPPDDYGSNNKLNKLIIGSDEYTYAHDANGNMSQEATNRFFEWDAFDRLRSFYDQPSTGSEPTVYEQYLYDSEGNRVKKLTRKSSSLHETIVYIDGLFEYIMKDDSGTIEEKNIEHMMDEERRIATQRTGSFSSDDNEPLKYVLEDHLQSSTIRLNAHGGKIDREEFFPYGESSLRDYAKKRYRFTGKERDEHSGLYYFGARYYAPWLGRFTSVDPKRGETPNLSPYIYGDANPIVFNDPSGNQSENQSGGEKGGNKQNNSCSSTCQKQETSQVSQDTYQSSDGETANTELATDNPSIGPTENSASSSSDQESADNLQPASDSNIDLTPQNKVAKQDNVRVKETEQKLEINKEKIEPEPNPLTEGTPSEPPDQGSIKYPSKSLYSSQYQNRSDLQLTKAVVRGASIAGDVIQSGRVLKATISAGEEYAEKRGDVSEMDWSEPALELVPGVPDVAQDVVGSGVDINYKGDVKTVIDGGITPKEFSKDVAPKLMKRSMKKGVNR
jgi:RHS repeat-associated protein